MSNLKEMKNEDNDSPEKLLEMEMKKSREKALETLVLFF